MSYQVAYNPTDAPVLIDFEGRSLGGREWGVVDRSDELVVAALEADRLRTYPSGVDAADDTDPDALAANTLAAELEDRRGRLGEVAVDELRAAAVRAAVVPADQADDVDKPRLVRMLTRRTDIGVDDVIHAGVEAEPSPSPADATPAEPDAPTVPGSEPETTTRRRSR